jgi:AcrR family transcriptional regulator
MPPDAAALPADVPARTPRSARATAVVAAASRLMEAEGASALTMRRIADDLGIKAPSLYKHFPDKAALESALVEQALIDMGTALHTALARPGRRGPVVALLAAYRREGLDHPNLYRLATAGPLARAELPPGLEDWAGEPFFLVTGEPHRAQALWSFAHGMVILEIDRRFREGSDLDRTWRAGAVAFDPAH